MVWYAWVPCQHAGMRRKGGNGSGARGSGSDAVRARILEAAFAAFTEHGFAQASTLDIATRARVSKRELYAQFDSKEAMLAACIEARAARMRAPIEQWPLRDRASLERALQAFGESTLRHATDGAVVGVHRLAIADALRAPEAARVLHEAGRKANQAALARLLDQAVELRLVPPGDAQALAAQFLALLWGDLMLRLLLGVARRPGAAQITARASDAVRDFLALHAEDRRPAERN